MFPLSLEKGLKQIWTECVCNSTYLIFLPSSMNPIGFLPLIDTLSGKARTRNSNPDMQIFGVAENEKGERRRAREKVILVPYHQPSLSHHRQLLQFLQSSQDEMHLCMPQNQLLLVYGDRIILLFGTSYHPFRPFVSKRLEREIDISHFSWRKIGKLY